MRNGLKALRLVFPMCPLRLTFYMLLSLPGAVLPAAGSLADRNLYGV